MIDEPTRTLREEQDQSCENDCGDNLDAERYPPLRVVFEVGIAAICRPSGDKSADSKHELLKTRHTSSDRRV